MLFSPTHFLFPSFKRCCAGDTGVVVSWGLLGTHRCGMSPRTGSGMLWGCQALHSKTAEMGKKLPVQLQCLMCQFLQHLYSC